MEKPWLCSVLLLCTQEAARAICGLWKKCLLNYWGFLDCDDRRSPWWTSRVGPQHDTVMISTSFNSYASLAIFFIISVLFCFFFFFWTRNYIHYTSVSCVWLLLSYRSLQSNWVWKPSKLGLHFVYSLRIFVSAHVTIRRLACLQTLFGSFVAICRLASSGFSLSIKEK